MPFDMLIVSYRKSKFDDINFYTVSMIDQPYSDSNILQQCFDLLKESITLIERFPKSQRFLLGNRLQSFTSDLLELYIDAYYASDKKQKTKQLQQANLQLEKLRFFWRLAYEMRFLSSGQYRLLANTILQLGKMTGGWLKKLKRGRSS